MGVATEPLQVALGCRAPAGVALTACTASATPADRMQTAQAAAIPRLGRRCVVAVVSMRWGPGSARRSHGGADSRRARATESLSAAD